MDKRLKIFTIFSLAVLLAAFPAGFTCCAAPALRSVAPSAAGNRGEAASGANAASVSARGSAAADEPQWVAESLEETLRRDVTFLADTTHRGREFGGAGEQGAIFYITRAFREAGLWTRLQSFRDGDHIGHNVIGMTPGFYSRYVLVSAYVDGLGVIDGKVYPGADSNASGVAALMSLAKSLAKSSFDRGTGIIFVAFDGHASNMSGSKAFLDRLGSEYNIVLMANIDIVGSTLVPVRKNRPDYLMVLGGTGYSFSLERANRGIGLHLSYDYYGSRNFTDLFYKSLGDQKWFISKKIPAVMFTSGITDNTNKLTDTPETLDYEILAKRVRLMSKWIESQL